MKMKINKVSDLFNVKDNQAELEFPNIVIDGADNRLYVDGIQIAGNSDALSKRCNLIIEDFFNTVFEHLKDENSSFEVKKLLDQSKEKNSLRLGKSEISPGVLAEGKGCSQEMLHKLFTRVETRTLVKSGVIKKPMDTILFIKGFGEDRMSDLLVSLIFKELVEFTNRQAAKAPNKPQIQENIEGSFWNHITHQWDTFTYNQILDLQNRPLILVPKSFVTDKYVYRVDRYISSCLLAYEIEMRKQENPNYKCNLKELKKELQNSLGKTGTEFVIAYTLGHPEGNLVARFRRDNEHNSKGTAYRGKLTDDKLTTIIEAPYTEIDNIG
ncbi:hypothetical protein [Rummeliibacillus sp. BSL5]